MVKHLLTFTLLLLVPLTIVQAENKLEFSVSPSFGHTYGETEYIMDITSAFIDENGDLIVDEFGQPIIFQLKSQLEYPLDVVTAGVNVRLNSVADPSKWSLEAGIFTSVNDPGGIMKDSDWEGAIGYFPLTQWSYTESSAKMSSLMLNVEATHRVLSPGKLRISALGGFRYHRIEQELFGVDGWQRTFDDINMEFEDPFFFDLLGDTQVLYYEVKYIMPLIGLHSTTDLSPNLSAGLKTIFSPVWYKDVDDHVLRNKISEADGNGLGFIGSLTARYWLGSRGGAAVPYVDFFAEYTTISTTGSQTQKWYGDDEITPDDDTGNFIAGIPHDVNATLYHLGLKIGMSF